MLRADHDKDHFIGRLRLGFLSNGPRHTMDFWIKQAEPWTPFTPLQTLVSGATGSNRALFSNFTHFRSNINPIHSVMSSKTTSIHNAHSSKFQNPPRCEPMNTPFPSSDESTLSITISAPVRKRFTTPGR